MFLRSLYRQISSDHSCVIVKKLLSLLAYLYPLSRFSALTWKIVRKCIPGMQLLHCKVHNPSVNPNSSATVSGLCRKTTKMQAYAVFCCSWADSFWQTWRARNGSFRRCQSSPVGTGCSYSWDYSPEAEHGKMKWQGLGLKMLTTLLDAGF